MARTTTPAPARRFAGSRRQILAGLGMSTPWVVGFMVFGLGPIVASLYYSFTDYDLFSEPSWVGLENYAAMVGDERLLSALVNTGFFVLIGGPLGLAIALVCALALNFPVRGQPLYRALLYLPAIVPMVSATYVWRWVLNAQHGVLNRFIEGIGLPAPNWLMDPVWTKPAVLLIMFWGIGGTSIIFLAALQQVPQVYYEAAAVDGANTWHRFRHVTLPGIAPVTLFQLIMATIASLQIFAQPYLLAQERLNPASGGPDNSLLTYAIYLFQNAFVFFKMGYESAMAWVLFLIIGALTCLILVTSRKWVHYGVE